jgi:tetratricopeptide (TPR) repeat protein
MLSHSVRLLLTLMIAAIILFVPRFAVATCEITDPSIKELVDSQKYIDAEEKANQALRDRPEDKSVHTDLALVYLRWATKSAVQVDVTALGLQPGETGTVKVTSEMVKKAFKPAVQFDPDKIAKCKTIFKRLIEKWPKDRDAHFCLMDIYQKNGEFNAFLTELETISDLFKLDSGIVDELLPYPFFYYENGQNDLALLTYEALLKHFPKSAPVISSYGVTQIKSGNLSTALKLFEKAYEIDSKDRLIIGNIIEAATYIRDFEKAEMFINKALLLEPEKTSKYFDLAILKMRNSPKDSLEVWEQYQKRHEKYPDEPGWAKNASLIEQKIRAGITDDDVFGLVQQFIQIHAEKYSIPLLHYLQSKHPSEAAYYMSMAHAYDNMGFFKSAIDQLLKAEKVLETKQSLYQITPEMVNFNLGRMYSAIESYGDALERFLRVYKANPKAKNINYSLGRTYAILKQNELAKKYLENCITSEADKSYQSHCKSILTRINTENK